MLQCRPWRVLKTWDLIDIFKMCWPSYFNLHAINLQIVSTQTVHHQPAHPCKPTNCRLPAWVRITTSKIRCPSCGIFPNNKSPASASTVLGSGTTSLLAIPWNIHPQQDFRKTHQNFLPQIIGCHHTVNPKLQTLGISDSSVKVPRC